MIIQKDPSVIPLQVKNTINHELNTASLFHTKQQVQIFGSRKLRLLGITRVVSSRSDSSPLTQLPKTIVQFSAKKRVEGEKERS